MADTDKENISCELNEDQQRFVDECEKEFDNRYTDDDPDYKKVLENGIGNPPVVDPWYNKPKRNFNYRDRRDRNDDRRDRHDDRRDRHDDRRGDRRDRYRYDDRRDRYGNSGDDGRYRNRQNYGRRHNPY